MSQHTSLVQQTRPISTVTSITSTTSWSVLASQVAGLAGASVVALAAIVIWSSRIAIGEDVYVSQLGAPSMPTADVFNSALLALGLGGVVAAVSCRGQRSTARVLGAWTASTTLVLTGTAFVVASRVTCTDGCPVPFTAGSTLQDLVHVTFAGVGFAAASWAMVQVATSPVPRAVRAASVLAAAGTGLVAAAGALLSVLRVRTDVGAMLEFVAMTIAVAWLVGFSVWSVLVSQQAETARESRTSSRTSSSTSKETTTRTSVSSCSSRREVLREARRASS